MGWESEQENLPEQVDYTKRILYAIPVVLVLMSIVLWLTHEDTSYNSRVKAKHIVVLADQGNVEQRAEALEKIIDVKRQLDEGADFDELAGRYSDDDINRDKGGMLGWLQRGDTVEKFDAYLWIGEIGKVSDPIESSYGYHLIYILEREISDAELYQLELNERLNKINQSNE